MRRRREQQRQRLQVRQQQVSVLRLLQPVVLAWLQALSAAVSALRPRLPVAAALPTAWPKPPVVKQVRAVWQLAFLVSREQEPVQRQRQSAVQHKGSARLLAAAHNRRSPTPVAAPVAGPVVGLPRHCQKPVPRVPRRLSVRSQPARHPAPPTVPPSPLPMRCRKAIAAAVPKHPNSTIRNERTQKDALC